MYIYIHKSYVCVHVQSNSSHTAHVPTNKQAHIDTSLYMDL